MKTYITQQFHYDSYLHYCTLNNKLSTPSLTLLTIDKQQTVIIFGNRKQNTELFFSLDIGYEKIINQFLKTSPIKSIAIEYTIYVIKNKLNTIPLDISKNNTFICKSKIIDQLTTLYGIKESHQCTLTLQQLESTFISLTKSILNNTSPHETYCQKKISIAIILLLKEIMHYLKYETIFIIK